MGKGVIWGLHLFSLKAPVSWDPLGTGQTALCPSYPHRLQDPGLQRLAEVLRGYLPWKHPVVDPSQSLAFRFPAVLLSSGMWSTRPRRLLDFLEVFGFIFTTLFSDCFSNFLTHFIKDSACH